MQRVGELRLAGEDRVDCALDPAVEERLGHADITIDAGAHVLGAAGRELHREFRVGEQLAPHGDHVRLAFPNQAVAHLWLDAPRHDHWHRHPRLDAGRESGKASLAVDDRRLGEASAQRVRVGRDGDRVGARLLRQLGRPLGILEHDAAGGAEFSGIEPAPDREARARPLLAGADRLAQEARTVLDRAAVLVLAEVPGRR